MAEKHPGAADPQSPVREGDVLAGKYAVERVLGTGAMGIVVAARHIHLNERVALKFLLPALTKDADLVTRFLREAQAAVRIKSEHVARVSDVGTLENGAPYIVMEYLTGADLARVIQVRGPLPIAEAAEYVLQASEAIAEAHSMGIVHRDLKPANLFLTERADGSALVKVLDFGISKAVASAAEASLTATSLVMGSPMYMAPEQIRNSKAVDARADVWSLGMILYELVAGVTAFDADTLPGLLASIVADPAPSLREKRPEVAAAFDAAVLRCLEKDVTRRTPNVAVLASDIAPFAAPHARASAERIRRVLASSSAVRSTGAIDLSGPAAPMSPMAATEAPWAQTRPSVRRRTLIRAVTLGALLAAGGGAVFAFSPAVRSALSHTSAASDRPTAAPAAPPPSGPVIAPIAPPAASPSVSAPSPRATPHNEPQPGRGGRGHAKHSAPVVAPEPQAREAPPPAAPSAPQPPPPSTPKGDIGDLLDTH